MKRKELIEIFMTLKPKYYWNLVVLSQFFGFLKNVSPLTHIQFVSVAAYNFETLKCWSRP